ncbi:MAG TPA: hypothetical protein VF765_17260 [Polyangiaceae bacterium]
MTHVGMRAFPLVMACALCMCGRSGLGAGHDGGGADTDASATHDEAATDAPASSSSSGGGEDDAATEPDVVGQPDSGSAGCPTTMPGPGPCDTNGLMCTYPGGPCTCTSGCTMGECCPTSCAMLRFPCAPAGDGCGGILHCRECPTGDSCGKDGACLGPGAGCTPIPCPASACGIIDDGCGGKIDCGECFWSCVLAGP